MAETKYNDKGQVREAYAEENADNAKELIYKLIALDANWIYEDDLKRLERWLKS